MAIPMSAIDTIQNYQEPDSHNNSNTQSSQTPPAPKMTELEDIRETASLDRSSIIFTAGATISIDAPAKEVFAVITNFSNYAAWNQDPPQMNMTSSGPLREASTLTMKVIMVDQKREYDVPVEILKYSDPDEDGVYMLAWRSMMLPAWFGVSERMQEVRPVEGRSDQCEVCNFESMAGWGACVFKYVMGIPEQMKKFNVKYLEDLKWEVEKTRSLK